MKCEVDTNDQFLVVELPIRITNAEVIQLMAAAKARSSGNKNPLFTASNLRVSAARDRALELIALRKQREKLMGTDLFGEPAWDMLLDLFVQRVDSQRVSTTSAVIAGRVPNSTGLRHLNNLVRRGLVNQNAANHDLRIQYVSLSESCYQQMLELLGG